MKQDRGNVLFIILAGIVLFAGLTYAVMETNENDGDIDQEQLRLDISEFIHNMEMVRAVIAGMKARGIPDTAIELRRNGSTGNPNCTHNGCRVFHPEGGGLTFIEAPDSMQKPLPWGAWHGLRFAGSDPFIGHGTHGTSASNSDLVASLGTTETACIEYNKMVDFTAFTPNVGPDVQVNNAEWAGTYTYSTYQVSNNAFHGVRTFCSQHPTNHEYRIYYVLLAR